MEDFSVKRTKLDPPFSSSKDHDKQQPPCSWPTKANLAMNGLEDKAGASTCSSNWVVPGRDWRTNQAAAFYASDSTELGQAVKSKQAGMRRMLLQSAQLQQAQVVLPDQY